MSRVLADYVTKVQVEVDDTSASAKTVIENSIKAIYQETVIENGKDLIPTTVETETTVSGTQAYTTDTDYQELLAVHYKAPSASDYVRLQPISEQEFNNLDVNLDNDDPISYYIKAQNIYMTPIPNGVGTLRFNYIPVQDELTALQVSIVPDRYDDVIVMGATYRFQAWDKDPSTPDYKRFYEEAKRKMKLVLATASEQRKPTFFGRRTARLSELR